MKQELIRNFVIISHIDHGKSTLADRLLEFTGTVAHRDMKEQILDNMELERERGITIKLQPARMSYLFDGEAYELNLIDTPGHVDFTYEVSRSLAAVEGAILLVDATKGVQAQTLANLELAKKMGLTIIPAVNKIDLPESRPDEVALEICEILSCELDEVNFISAKTGEGIEGLLEGVIKKVPHPKSGDKSYPRALVFDSYYDDYRGVVVYVRVFDGSFKRGDKIVFGQQKKISDASDVGAIQLGLKSTENLNDGEIGFIVTSFREVSEARVGETISLSSKDSEIELLPGYQEPKPMVYAEIYTSTGEDYNKLRDALNKLKLSDSSVLFEPSSSKAFGFGFRCGFLGLLHLEIVKERLEREYDLELIVTTPTVDNKIDKLGKYSEPWTKLEVISPREYLGRIIELLESRRGLQQNIRHLDEKIIIEYEIPLSEIIIDFYDQIKSLTQGYGSVNYELTGWKESDLVKLDFAIAGEVIDAFSRMVYRGFAERIARQIVEKMKEYIPRQNFEVKIQAMVGSRVLASERISPFRKDVTEKLYGGDVTRKRKLLEKQKKGKKKMAQMGRLQLPTDVFIKLLKQ